MQHFGIDDRPMQAQEDLLGLVVDVQIYILGVLEEGPRWKVLAQRSF